MPSSFWPESGGDSGQEAGGADGALNGVSVVGQSNHDVNGGTEGGGRGTAGTDGALEAAVSAAAAANPTITLCHSATCGGNSPRPRPPWQKGGRHEGPHGELEEGEEEGEEGEEEPTEGALPLMGWVLFLLSSVGFVVAFRTVTQEARAQPFLHHRIPPPEDRDYVRVGSTV